MEEPKVKFCIQMHELWYSKCTSEEVRAKTVFLQTQALTAKACGVSVHSV
jgi:hypothetical protein